jgi:hypothetical protein
MLYQPSLTALRLLPRSTYVIKSRVDALQSVISRVSKPSAILNGSITHQSSLPTPLTCPLPLSWSRNFASRPASRPKAHTGRATTKAGSTTRAAKSSTEAKLKSKQKSKAKSSPKKATKKSLTEEAKKKAAISQAKKLALKEPKAAPATAYLVLTAEIGQQKGSLAGKEASEKWKNLDPSELEVQYAPIGRAIFNSLILFVLLLPSTTIT